MRCRVGISLLSAVLIATGCTRRPLEGEQVGPGGRIPVKIDWSRSGIPVSQDDISGGGYVHRVSLRFYPDDGSEIFERYLESNIFEGTIDVPPGSYQVIAMNESIEDRLYWEDAITFSNVDDYERFSAAVNPMSAGDVAAGFPFYRPLPDESLTVEPLALASWSLDSFVVSADGPVPLDLTEIVMRGLTHTVSVRVRTQNLVSVFSMSAAARGFASRVYIASGRTEQTPVTQLFRFTGRRWYDNHLDGEALHSFLSFGRLPVEEDGAYQMALDILLVSGELYTEDGAMLFDVTDQVKSSPRPGIEIVLPGDPPGGMIRLPYIDGGIAVGPWEDEEVYLN